MSMSRGALPGEHYCENHQGNHSHYANTNCTVCKLEQENERLSRAWMNLQKRASADKVVEMEATINRMVFERDRKDEQHKYVVRELEQRLAALTKRNWELAHICCMYDVPEEILFKQGGG